MARVTAPVSDFTGKVAGVAFTDGTGETDAAAALEYFERQGYTIEADAPAFPEGDPGKAWKVDELRAFAQAKGVDLGEAKTKDDILAVLVTPPVPPSDAPAE